MNETNKWIRCSEREPENYEDKHFRTANDKLPIRMPVKWMKFYYTPDKIEWLEETDSNLNSSCKITQPVHVGLWAWWYRGCFIHKQSHPKLNRYHVSQDTKEQKTVGVCDTFNEAMDIAGSNFVSDYLIGPEPFK
jgi:hypothetical protein